MRPRGLIAGATLAVGMGILPACTPAEELPTTDTAAEPTFFCPNDFPECDPTNALMVLGGEISIPVTIDQMSQNAIAALIALEDRNFLNHDGVDDPAILRALLQNVIEGEIVEGASTITMQMVSLKYKLPIEPNLKEKLYEAQVALKEELETPGATKFEKKLKILEQYFNLVYFGNGAYGLEAASLAYFGIHAKELTLQQAGFIIGRINKPSLGDNLSDPKEAARAQADPQLVMDNMKEVGMITPEVAAANSRIDTMVFQNALPRNAAGHTLLSQQIGGQYFGEIVKYQTASLLGVNVDDIPGGLRVETTLDIDDQRNLSQAVNFFRPPPGGPDIGAEAQLLDGSVIAMVGGDFRVSEFNRATSGGEAGSALKQVPVAELFEVHPEYQPDTYLDMPAIFEWPGGDAGRNWPVEATAQTYSISDALANSHNAFFAKTAFEVGYDRVVEAWQKLGLPVENATPSAILGSVNVSVHDLTTYEASIARGGRYIPAHFINRIIGPDGAILYEYKPPVAEPIWTPDVAAKTIQVSRAPVRYGTAADAFSEFPQNVDLIGKTGTQENNTVAVNIAATVTRAVGVRMQNDDNQPMPGQYGGGTPAFIAATYMSVSPQIAEAKLPAGA